MNSDKHVADIERMAREAGAFPPGRDRNHWAVTEPALARFAALVRAQALEDAARVAEGTGFHSLCCMESAGVAAAAIRALGDTK